MIRRLVSMIAVAAALPVPVAASAQSAQFDLHGPALEASVTRGGETLPLSAVPALAPGDRLQLRARLPDDQSERFLLVVAFLRGATNPPPKDWFRRAQTWRRGRDALDIMVPDGAQQAVLLLAPETGGGYDAIVEAVRGRPGIFVRAAQDLAQASLDRARLDAFVDGVARADASGPGRVAATAEALGRSLAVRVDAGCLARPVRVQAVCLAQSRDSMLLYSARTTSLAETLTGAPTDLAYRVSATREGGSGFYSPYIGVVRDVARLLGAFRTAQYQYVPALTSGRGETIGLLLNTAPSFTAPQSVLVSALPPIGNATPPRITPPPDPICVAGPATLIPAPDAPLLFATAYPRDMRVRIEGADGKIAEQPFRIDAASGGLVSEEGVNLVGPMHGRIKGRWGFDQLDGPEMALQGAGAVWRAGEDASPVVGRDERVRLIGGGSACVEGVAAAIGAAPPRAVEWRATGPDRIEAVLPLSDARPGDVTVLVRRRGVTEPDRITLRALAEASGVDALRIHAGDRSAMLHGRRLDQVADVTLGDLAMTPISLERRGEGDRLTIQAATSHQAPEAGQRLTARISLKDGRLLSVPVQVQPARPHATIMASHVERARAAAGTLRIETVGEAAIPADARATFSMRSDGGAFTGNDIIEVTAANGSGAARITAANGLRLQDEAVALMTLVPASLLGSSAYGPLRFRVVRGDVAGDWQPLATLVRLPALHEVECPAEGDCTLTGRDLYLIAGISSEPDLADARAVPSGFPGSSLPVPRPHGNLLYLRLRDDPEGAARIVMPGAPAG